MARIHRITDAGSAINASERFWRRVDATGDCWEWTGCRQAGGYGRFGVTPTRIEQAHRFAYEDLVGPIPAGLVIDHLCRNTTCVNPDHLEPITRGANVLRGFGTAAMRARRKQCPKGHEYTADNIYLSRLGQRHCRTCRRRAAA